MFLGPVDGVYMARTIVKVCRITTSNVVFSYANMGSIADESATVTLYVVDAS